MDKIQIALGLDNSYARPALVLIHSLLKNNPGCDFSFHIISGGLSKKNVILFKKTFSERAQFFFYEASEKIISALPASEKKYLSPATYYRLLIPSLVPEGVQKILYLDTDMLCLSSILPLWNTDVSRFALCAGLDICAGDSSLYKRLGYKDEELYFNAGMLLMNLDYFRQNKICEKIFDAFPLHKGEWTSDDQDALNYFLHGRVKFVSSAFNAMTFIYRKDREKFILTKDQYEKMFLECKSPVVVHFVGAIKPWHYEYALESRPFAKSWQFFQKSLGVRVKKSFFYKRPFLLHIKFILKQILFLAGLYKSPRSDFFDFEGGPL